MSDLDIDNDILISLVEEKPVLWDKTLDIFKDLYATRNAWREVCQGLRNKFDELAEKGTTAFDESGCEADMAEGSVEEDSSEMLSPALAPVLQSMHTPAPTDLTCKDEEEIVIKHRLMKTVRDSIRPLKLKQKKLSYKATQGKFIGVEDHRGMLRVPYTAHRTNVSTLDELDNPKRLSSIVSTRMLSFFGHIHRSDNMEKPVVQGHAPSGRRRGRYPTRWVDTTKWLLDMSIKNATELTVNRER
ncbi:unnamed protein product [Callosobruchus maculatus]|uniref:MADF domain-containing protein n=1 Tax=Callosobruchus maculatus TaxID=64391 RepID=A0A653CBT8_CALMS|nr:unnamed protein product [Callosobruchus maculatus]